MIIILKFLTADTLPTDARKHIHTCTRTNTRTHATAQTTAPQQPQGSSQKWCRLALQKTVQWPTTQQRRCWATPHQERACLRIRKPLVWCRPVTGDSSSIEDFIQQWSCGVYQQQLSSPTSLALHCTCGAIYYVRAQCTNLWASSTNVVDRIEVFIVQWAV